MSSKRIVVVMMAIVVALTATLATAADGAKKRDTKKAAASAEAPTAKSTESEKAPRLTVVEPVHDYGTVAKGDKLTWTFAIKNTGTADLQVIAARPACGCTVADFDKVVKPGETGKVTAQVDTTAFTGPIAKSVTVETNDPTTPSAQLTIHATVKPYVEAYPAGFVRYSLLQGDADQQSIILYSDEDEPFAITSIEAPSGWVKVTSAKIENEADRVNMGRPGQNQYKVNVTVGGPEAKLGPLAEKIVVHTNSKHQPDFPISISGVVRPPFRVEPSAMNFGEVAPNDVAASRMVLLRSNDLKTPERFVVTKVESSTPIITTSLKPTANKGEYEVTLQLAKDAKPGDVDGTVTIYTNNTTTPKVTVPVKATVKTATTAAASSSK